MSTRESLIEKLVEEFPGVAMDPSWAGNVLDRVEAIDGKPAETYERVKGIYKSFGVYPLTVKKPVNVNFPHRSY